jgi:hypothetical protein
METTLALSGVTAVQLSHGQKLGLNIAYTVAVRTTFFVEALLALYAQRAGEPSTATEPVLAQLTEYRQLADELAGLCDLDGDPRDIRPLIVEQVSRIRDALNPRLVDELANFGRLDSDEERVLRQKLAVLSLMTDDVARAVQRLPPARI